MPSPSVRTILICCLNAPCNFSIAASDYFFFFSLTTHTLPDALSIKICEYFSPFLSLTYGSCKSVMMYSPGLRSVLLPVDLDEWFPVCIFPLIQLSHLKGVLGTFKLGMKQFLQIFRPTWPNLLCHLSLITHLLFQMIFCK